MLKTFLSTIIIGLGLLIGWPPIVAHAYDPGDMIWAGEFCFNVDEQWMKDFTATVTTDGLEGYLKIITSPDNECYDVRVFPQFPNMLLLLEKVIWEFQPLDMKDSLEMWEAQDVDGELVYTWVRIVLDPEA